jgi:type IV pilus assembly protein PilM
MSIKQKLFGGGSEAMLGLDISSSAVKLLEFGRKGTGFEVLAYAVEPLPPNAVVDKQIAEPEVVGQAIQRAVAKAGTRTKGAAVAVAGPAVITKVVQMSSFLKEDDMEEQIRAEADQYIPYPIEEVSIDFQIMGPSASGGEMVDVLLAACRKEQVESRCAAIAVGGLKPRVVDIESYALESACRLLTHQMPQHGRDQTVAIIDMGASSTSMLVLHDMKTVYARDTAFGGKQLTEDIMRTFGMSYEEAGRAKRAGSLPETYAAEVLEPFLADMTQQIDRGLQFFFSAASQYTSVDQLILAGGCAQIPDVDRFIEGRLRIPTVVAKPFSTLTVTSRAKPNVLGRDEASLLLASGLALRAFDDEEA